MLKKMNMNDMSAKMMARFFKKVDGVVWDLFSGKIGVQDEEGIVTLEGEGEDAQIVLNLMDQFGMPVPAYAQNTPVNSVAVGDIIYQGNKVKGWVTGVLRAKSTSENNEDGTDSNVLGDVKRFQLMTPGGMTTTWTPPKVSMLGFDSGVMVLRSLMNMLPGGKAGVDNMQSMMIPMMMSGGDMDMESIMPMMLMGQLGTAGDGSNAMGGNMMQTMMIMQMFKGNNNNNRHRPGKKGNNFFDDGE